MSARRRVALIALAAVLAGGCAAGPAGLDVQYPEAGVNRAMLSTVAAREVEIVPVVDRRVDPTRIGTSPKTGKDIVPARPVTEVVREALARELGKNGHALVAGRRDVALAATVEEFWLDTVVGYSSTQYVGKIAVALAVTDGRTGDALLARRYIGIKRRAAETDSAGEATEREVMDAALARVMHDLATDPELVRALAAVPAARP
jgi:uncharacterized lipoprotein YajG